MENRTFALSALDKWYKASTVSIGPGQNAGWAGVLDYYSKGKNTNFLNDFGAAVRTIPQDRVAKAMQALGKKFGYVYPDKMEFFNAIASEVSTPTAAEVAKAAGAGVLDAGKAAVEAAKSSLFVYVAIAAIGAFIIPSIAKELGKKGGASSA